LKRWLRLLFGLVCVVLLIIGIRQGLKGQLQKRREVAYETTLKSYQQTLKQGMTRKEVEDYLGTRKQTFTQSCCVDPKEFQKHSWDDLVEIGAEDALGFVARELSMWRFNSAQKRNRIRTCGEPMIWTP
jgi:hypothetical protein